VSARPAAAAVVVVAAAAVVSAAAIAVATAAAAAGAAVVVATSATAIVVAVVVATGSAETRERYGSESAGALGRPRFRHFGGYTTQLGLRADRLEPIMGAVMTKLKLTNSVDLAYAREGRITPEQVRSVEVEALVDTGATTLVLPADLVASLGVHELVRSEVRMADGSLRPVPIVGDLVIEILGRSMSCDAVVMPAGTLPLIGHIQLERLDLLVNPKSHELTVNPASPDVPRLDLLRVA
jgi:clan AA aspartic protease